jgi:putative flippase GtrA
MDKYMPVVRQFFTFSGVGLIGTAAQYITLIVLVRAADIYSVLASSIGFIIGAIVNYILNYHITFASKKSHHDAIWKFFSVAFVGLFLNAIIMQFFISYLMVPYLLAQVFATGLVLVWHFSANRMWTFMERNI